jgi:predicted dehydrogenase
MTEYTRRAFLETASAATLGASLGPSVQSRPDGVPPSDQLRFGVIGCNGMGWANLNAHQRLPGVECVALCDVDRNVLEKRAGELEEQIGRRPALYDDYRRLLGEDDVDFVVIATPDHWHCLPMVEACQAGKDVYVEKPLGNSIGECLLMQQAAAQTGRVVQVGQWQRSAPHWQQAVDYVRSGSLGTIRTVKAWAYQGWMEPIDPAPNQEPPDGVDYDFWLGPAPERPFNPNRFHFDFRWFWDYAGGLMTDWGVHLIDYALYGMDADTPNAVMSGGGPFGYPPSVDASETPDTQQALYTFDDFTLIWEHATGIDGGPYGRDHGVAFIGNNGTLVVDRGGWEVRPEADDGTYKLDAIPPRDGGGGLDRHAKNFVDSIRGDATPNCPVDVAAPTAIVAHLGNVAYRIGRRVEWDADAHQFVDDPDADAHIWPSYRDPWSLPNP